MPSCKDTECTIAFYSNAHEKGVRFFFGHQEHHLVQSILVRNGVPVRRLELFYMDLHPNGELSPFWRSILKSLLKSEAAKYFEGVATDFLVRLFNITPEWWLKEQIRKDNKKLPV